MGLLDSALSFVSSCISATARIVSSVSSAIGNAVSGLAGSLLKLVPHLNTIITVVQVIAQILGILKPEETPEDFDTTDEYITHLREEVEFDKEEFDKLSDEEKLARSVIGTAISMKAINENKGFEVTLDTWTSMAKLYDKGLLGKESLGGLIDEFKDTQSDLNGYVNKEIKGAKGVEIGGKLAQAYQKLEPELSTEAINEKVLNSKIGE